MNVQNFIQEWIKVSNSYDIEKYLSMFNSDAILNDPSVGKKFKAHKGIRQYFETYFIGYNTQTALRRLTIKSEAEAFVEVEFKGDFPGSILDGSFEIRFEHEKISFVKADLV